MDTETARRIWDNHEWFSKLLDDLVTLLDKHVENGLREKLGYDGEGWSGFPSRKYQPTMPAYYRRVFEGKGLPYIQVTALLQKDWDNRNIPTGEPTLMVVAHDAKENSFGISQNILDFANIKKYEPSKDKTSFAGVLDWEEPVKFHGFFVPLDSFSEDSCIDVDATVREKIIEPLRVILDAHFSKPGMKSKSGA